MTSEIPRTDECQWYDSCCNKDKAMDPIPCALYSCSPNTGLQRSRGAANPLPGEGASSAPESHLSFLRSGEPAPKAAKQSMATPWFCSVVATPRRASKYHGARCEQIHLRTYTESSSLSVIYPHGHACKERALSKHKRHVSCHEAYNSPRSTLFETNAMASVLRSSTPFT